MIKLKTMTDENNEREPKLDALNPSDNCGRRKNVDRRQFAYTIYIPERRVGEDRRNGMDRRQNTRTPLNS